jgi:hypothetical protein
MRRKSTEVPKFKSDVDETDRVPIADLEQARRVAKETRIGYQTVLKQAIRKGLKRAG